MGYSKCARGGPTFISGVGWWVSFMWGGWCGVLGVSGWGRSTIHFIYDDPVIDTIFNLNNL